MATPAERFDEVVSMKLVADSFADLLRSHMRGKSQRDVADEIGVSQSRVSRWLAGGLPDRDKLPLVAKWLGVSDMELYKFLREHHQSTSVRLSSGERLDRLERELPELRQELAALRKALEDSGRIKPRKR